MSSGVSGLLPGVVPPRLGAVAARLHRAPAPASVARVIDEQPAACRVGGNVIGGRRACVLLRVRRPPRPRERRASQARCQWSTEEESKRYAAVRVRDVRPRRARGLGQARDGAAARDRLLVTARVIAPFALLGCARGGEARDLGGPICERIPSPYTTRRTAQSETQARRVSNAPRRRTRQPSGSACSSKVAPVTEREIVDELSFTGKANGLITP